MNMLDDVHGGTDGSSESQLVGSTVFGSSEFITRKTGAIRVVRRSVLLEVASAVEMSFLAKMVVDRGVNCDEFLQTSHAPKPQHGSVQNLSHIFFRRRLRVLIFSLQTAASCPCTFVLPICRPRYVSNEQQPG